MFRSGASESASGSLPPRSARFARANCFTPIIPHPIFFFLPCLHPCTVPHTCTGSQWNSNVRVRTTIAFCLCLCLGATLPTCVGCFVCCHFSLLTLPLEPFYACYVLCSMFLPQHSSAALLLWCRSHACTPIPRHTFSMVAEGWEAGRVEASGEKLKHDAFVVFQIKQATRMCVCLRFRLASRLAPLSSSPPCVAAGWLAGWVNRKKKGAKDKQDKQFWLTNLTTYQVYHVHGFAVHVSTILRCPLSPDASCTLLLQVKAPKGKPHAAHVVQDVRNKKDGLLKYKKVFCAFCAFYPLPFSLPLELPLIVCYAFCAF